MKKILLIIVSFFALQTMPAANWLFSSSQITPEDEAALAVLQSRPVTPDGFLGCQPYGVILTARSKSSCSREMTARVQEENHSRELTSPPPIK